MSTFEVGQAVKIANSGQCYDTYHNAICNTEFFGQWTSGDIPLTGRVGIIVYITEEFLYFVRIAEQVFIMGASGIELHDKQPAYSVGDCVEITNPDHCHNMASSWIENTIWYGDWINCELPTTGMICTIVSITASRQFEDAKFIYFVQHNDTAQVFLMSNGFGIYGAVIPEEIVGEVKENSTCYITYLREKYQSLFDDEYFSIDIFKDTFDVNDQEYFYKCSTKQELEQVLDALVTLNKFKGN